MNSKRIIFHNVYQVFSAKCVSFRCSREISVSTLPQQLFVYFRNWHAKLSIFFIKIQAQIKKVNNKKNPDFYFTILIIIFFFFHFSSYEEPQIIMHGNDIEIALASRRSLLALRLYPTVNDVVRSMLFSEHGSSPSFLRKKLPTDVCFDIPAPVRIIAIVNVAHFQIGVFKSRATGKRTPEKRIDLDSWKRLQ